MEMILNFDTIMLALGLTMIAGLSTGIGGLMSFFSKATNTRFLSAALGLSAGVMVYVSLLEMMPEAYEKMAEVFEGKLGKVYVLLAFFAGMAMIALIDFFIPEDENPHEFHRKPIQGQSPQKLQRTGLMLALAIGIHNFPEGIATFVSVPSIEKTPSVTMIRKRCACARFKQSSNSSISALA